MKVAAYQAPLLPYDSMTVLRLIRSRVDWCESEGVGFLCCPEAILGGLADDVASPADIAINMESGQLEAVLVPLTSRTVTIIVGFTEVTQAGHFYNSAAIFYQGSVIGVYRKLHPAIRKSIYKAGDQIPVFTINNLTFGIMICNDTNYPEPARIIKAQGATAIFVPTNNALPPEKADVVADAKRADIALAKENGLTIIRADVAGHNADLVSYGSSNIVAPDGRVLVEARPFVEDLVIAEIDAACENGYDAVLR